jgi:hypothetical protein
LGEVDEACPRIATPGPVIEPITAFEVLPLEVEATTPAPTPVCVTFTTWSGVEPVRFVGPAIAVHFLVPLLAGLVVPVDDGAGLEFETFAAGFAPPASTKSEILLPPSVSASCALRA